MEKVFLSYTYRPHPDHKQPLETLEAAVRRIIEAMGCRVLDGRDLGGNGLTPAVQARIKEADGLIALLTPQADDNGNVTPPRFVESELNFARGNERLRTIAVVHDLVGTAGLPAQDEYIPYRNGMELDVVLKLASTLSLWREEAGRSIKVRVDPGAIAGRYDPDEVRHKCEYRTLTGSTQSPWTKTFIWPEPGGAFVYIPGLREDGLVRVRVDLDGEVWQSNFACPHLSGITLEKQP